MACLKAFQFDRQARRDLPVVEQQDCCDELMLSLLEIKYPYHYNFRDLFPGQLTMSLSFSRCWLVNSSFGRLGRLDDSVCNMVQ